MALDPRAPKEGTGRRTEWGDYVENTPRVAVLPGDSFLTMVRAPAEEGSHAVVPLPHPTASELPCRRNSNRHSSSPFLPHPVEALSSSQSVRPRGPPIVNPKHSQHHSLTWLPSVRLVYALRHRAGLTCFTARTLRPREVTRPHPFRL